jgi:serine/threonine-protein kinase RsbT
MEGKNVRKTFQIHFEWDIVYMRSEVRELAGGIGFDEVDQSRIVQSISELARNIIQHAEEGSITVELIERDGQQGLFIKVQDLGPGIPNVDELLSDVHTKTDKEKKGLSHVKMLMDDFRIHSDETGTAVEVIKWLKQSDEMINKK